MRTLYAAAALAAGLAFAPGTASAHLDLGEKAPDFEGKEYIGIDGPVSLKSLQGRVVLLEVFRTW